MFLKLIHTKITLKKFVIFLVVTKMVLKKNGVRLIQRGGFSYTVHLVRQLNEFIKTRWRCSTHCNKRCGAVIYTINDEIVKINDNHNHPPNELN